MKNKKSKVLKCSFRLSFAKVKARELMLADENYIKLLLAIIITVANSMVPYILLNMIYGIITPVSYFIILTLSEIFIIANMLYGIMKMVIRMSDGEETELADLFCGFASIKNVAVSLLSAVLIILPLCVPVIMSFAVAMVLQAFSALETVNGLIAVGIIIIFITPAIYLTCRMMPAYYFICGGNGIKYSFSKAFYITKRRARKIFAFGIKFLLLTALSFFAVLLPFLFYILPHTLCTYCVGIKTLCEK